MSATGGPDIVEDGLVLALDAANVKSFRGEPTTNLLPNPTSNAYPTLGNSWGTYNTNQYGNGNFFSIGSVSSVSNNIVTMTSNHSLRTYDAMRPQTTGGGVTANVDYFIKKISDTQFSLHAYNGSQDGSQGYINLSTGAHKVHDSIALDERISINSTNFPTMWWGAPHLPNSGLVKEIVAGGFKHPDTQIVTDCVRLHYIRTDDVKDGMSYNVDVNGMTTGINYTISFYTRASSAAATGKVIQYYIYNYTGGSATAYAWNFTLGQPGVWERHTFTYSPAYANMISYWFPQSSGVYSWEWSNMQVEQRSYSTAFVAGTRGTTVATGGGWVDRSGNSNHGELVNGPTYNSGNGGSLVFDAINDYVSIPSFTFTPYCLDFWLYNNNAVPANDGSIGGPSTYQTLIHYPGGMISLGGWTGAATNEALHIWSFTGGNKLTYTQTAVPVGNHNWVFNWNGTHYDIWVDGQKQTVYASTNGHALLGSLTNAIRLGYDGGTYYFHGRIYSFKMYGNQLSDNQVLQNYNATKGRFGL